MKIEVLGMGCAQCRKLYNNVLQALKAVGKEAEVTKVEDLDVIMNYAVMLTPALVIDGEVKSSGNVLSVEEIQCLL